MLEYCVTVGGKEKSVSSVETEAHTRAAALSLELKRPASVAAREIKKRGFKVIASYRDGKKQ